MLRSALLFLAVLAPIIPAAQAGSPTPEITILATFDYPGAVNATVTYGINQHGEIAGYYSDSPGAVHGYTRSRSGVFSSPIVDPNDASGATTDAAGINGAGTVDGFYYDSAGVLHGFFLSKGTYTPYDYPGLDGTLLFGLNNAGDFCGAAGNNTTFITSAFVNIGGVPSLINVPAGSYNAIAYSINDSSEVVGYYEQVPVTHGFLRSADGSVTAPLDYPGSLGTIPQSINNKGFIVGQYSDGHHYFAYVEKLPNRFISYHYPNAIDTAFTSINDKGEIAGYYMDSSGVIHGFAAQLR